MARCELPGRRFRCWARTPERSRTPRSHASGRGHGGEGAQACRPHPSPLPQAGEGVGLNLRDVPHGGFKIVGDQSLKVLTVHVVDKGKPLYDTVK